MKLPISVLILAKNEEKTIGFCIAPLKNKAQEIIVCDTGSQDRTIAIARSLGAKIMRMKLCQDFSAVRNAMIRKASCPWVLQLDADSRIAARDFSLLNRLMTKKNVFAYEFLRRNYTHDFNLFNSWQSCNNEYPKEERFSKMPGYYLSSQILFFRNDARLNYVFPVHESLRPAIDKHCLRVVKTKIPIHHFEFHKGLECHRKKHLFYLKLERKTVRQWPSHPDAYAHLIKDILFTQQNVREAERAGGKLTALAPRNPYNWFLRAVIAMLFEKWQEADRFISKSIKLKVSGDNLCLKGWIKLKTNSFDAAEIILLKAIQKKKENPLALNLLGVLKERSGKPVEAIRYFTRALKLLPGYDTAWLNLKAVLERKS